MLRLHRACFFHEWLLTFECEDWLGGLVPCTIGGVAMVGELYEVFKMGNVSFSAHTIFLSSGLNPINHDWGAVRGEIQSRKWLEGQNDSYCKWLILSMYNYRSLSNLPSEAFSNTKSKHLKKTNHFCSIITLYCGPEPCGFLCFPLRFTTMQADLISTQLSAWFSGRQVLYYSRWSNINMHTMNFQIDKKKVFLLPLFDIGLSILCLVIGQVHIGPWLVVGRS